MPVSDYTDIESLSEQLMDAANELAKKTRMVSAARQIREYDSDRRKRALSLAVRDVLNAAPDTSAAASEHKARASEGFGENMNQLRRELREAEQVIAEWEALKVRWESLRSLLSIQKQIATNL